MPPTAAAPAPDGDDRAGSAPAPAADSGERPLDPGSITAARFTGAVWTAFCSLASLVAATILAIAAPITGGVTVVIFSAALTLSGAAAVLTYVWPAVRYRHIRYCLDANGFTIRRGVFWRSVTSIPKSRIQHTDIVRGPVQRQYDLATLVIHTAGTQDASVSLSGLHQRTAIDIRDILIDGGADHGV